MAGTDIVTLDEVKKQLNIDLTDTSQDEELAVYISAVTEVVEDIVGPVMAREVVEANDGGSNVVILRKPPVLSVTEVVEDGSTLTVDDFTPSLEAGVLYRKLGWWAGGRGGVLVTYQAGRAAVLTDIPASIRLAAKELAQVNFRPQLGGDYSPFDTDSPEEGIPGEVRLGFFVPNRVKDLLKPYEQGGWLP